MTRIQFKIKQCAIKNLQQFHWSINANNKKDHEKIKYFEKKFQYCTKQSATITSENSNITQREIINLFFSSP